jgi:hypothetical protein
MKLNVPDRSIRKTGDYWRLVEAVLRDIFNTKDTGPLRDLKDDILYLPPQEQDLFYHAEPLDVAADLAGKANEDLSAYDGKYGELAKHLGWG